MTRMNSRKQFITEIGKKKRPYVLFHTTVVKMETLNEKWPPQLTRFQTFIHLTSAPKQSNESQKPM